MWKQGGRSLALDRAQALLSAKRHDTGAESSQRSAGKTRTHEDYGDGSTLTKSVPPALTFMSDLSDLSSVSSAPDHEAAPAWRSEDRSREPTQGVRPQSSLGGGVGGGSRFLKKAPPPPSNSSQEPEPRYVASSQRGYQNAALNRLDQIESRIRSHKQAQERNRQASKPSESKTSDFNISPVPGTKSPEAPLQPSAQSSSDQSLPRKRFLKKTTAANAAATSPRGQDSAGRSVSRAAEAVFPSVSWDKKPGRVVSGVSLESDEEDMKKLLGDSLDSMDSSSLKAGGPSSARTTDKTLGKSHSRIHSTIPPTVSPPHPAPTPSPASPSHRSSPFRFIGQAQAHFSPSALYPSPSPPRISPSPPKRLDRSHRAGSPQRSLSSMSGHSQVMSLEELFPVRSIAEDLQSDISEVFSEDFKINVMTLDDLAPANSGFTEEAPDKEQTEAELSPPKQLSRSKEEEEDEQQYEEEYSEDFESQTEPDHSASQVSEHLQSHGGEEEVVSEILERPADSEVSHGRRDDDYSRSYTDSSRSHSPHTANHSQTHSRSTESRSARSSVSRTSQSRRRCSSRKVLKDSAVQTQPDPLPGLWSAGASTLGPAYMHHSSAVPQAVSAEMVEALSTFNPAAFALNEVLKQHLALTRRFIERNRDLYLKLIKSLESPNYRYTTLEDTREHKRKQRPPKLIVEDALEDMMQEMKDHHI